MAMSFFFCLPSNGLAFLLYTKAIKVSALSVTVPYLAFTPAFAVVSGFLFLDELPGSWLCGAALIVFKG
jgi:drug/metabolite transporter (DMT)-like permease